MALEGKLREWPGNSTVLSCCTGKTTKAQQSKAPTYIKNSSYIKVKNKRKLWSHATNTATDKQSGTWQSWVLLSLFNVRPPSDGKRWYRKERAALCSQVAGLGSWVCDLGSCTGLALRRDPVLG